MCLILICTIQSNYSLEVLAQTVTTDTFTPADQPSYSVIGDQDVVASFEKMSGTTLSWPVVASTGTSCFVPIVLEPY